MKMITSASLLTIFFIIIVATVIYMFEVVQPLIFCESQRLRFVLQQRDIAIIVEECANTYVRFIERYAGIHLQRNKLYFITQETYAPQVHSRITASPLTLTKL